MDDEDISDYDDSWLDRIGKTRPYCRFCKGTRKRVVAGVATDEPCRVCAGTGYKLNFPPEREVRVCPR